MSTVVFVAKRNYQKSIKYVKLVHAFNKFKILFLKMCEQATLKNACSVQMKSLDRPLGDIILPPTPLVQCGVCNLSYGTCSKN